MHAALLMLVLMAQNDAPKPLTFAEMYDLQVDKTNDAVRIYGNAFCTDSNFMVLTMKAKIEYANLVDLRRLIPPDEADSVRIKQEELFIGVRFVTSKIATRQNKCLQDNTAPKPAPQIVPEGL